MGETVHKSFLIAERSYAALAKKEIRKIASKLEFTENREAEIDLIVSEIISNLLKHSSKGGEILVRVFPGEDGKGIEIIGIDRGAGIKDLKKMIGDGISTAKTLGHGLGSISRLSDEFDIYSVAGWGTVVFSRVWEKKKRKKENAPLEFDAILVSKEHENLCGDNWSTHETGQNLEIVVFDGLGHGPEAYKASKAAIDIFNNNTGLFPNEQLKIIHENIRSTRGCVGLILKIEKDKLNCIYSGIGNISSRCFSYQSSKNLISRNGTIGHIIPGKIANDTIDLTKFDLLVIHTDGLKTKFELNKHPGLLAHHPSLIAACVYNDQNRGTDDAAVVVVKLNKKYA